MKDFYDLNPGDPMLNCHTGKILVIRELVTEHDEFGNPICNYIITNEGTFLPKELIYVNEAQRLSSTSGKDGNDFS